MIDELEIAEDVECEPVTDSIVDTEDADAPDTDYKSVADEDIKTLRTLFPELCDAKSITELENPLRFAALRDLGLSAEEAYLATTKRRQRIDNRAHLTSSVPTATMPEGDMPRHELEAAREMFSGLSDKEIRALYRRVTK
ncbi:MAG: hypothetical protein J6Q69_01640 [Clostridia bacterium]|nr:hypothetical protein [Clostridia bacterium]